MNRLFLALLLFVLSAPCVMAQRKELSQARTYIKSGKDFNKAQKLMEDLLAKDSANRQNPRIYETLYLSVLKQYEAGNEKLYLKQSYDTASLFRLTKRMFEICQTLDSVEVRMATSKKAKPSHRRKHSEELNVYRPNLYNGGSYFIHKGDYQEAFRFFEAYMDCTRQPLFVSYQQQYLSDTLLTQAAYWATYCGYKLKDASMTMAHIDRALTYQPKRLPTLIYKAEGHWLNKDTAMYSSTLDQGFKEFPKSPYFFSHLIDYHTANNRQERALSIANSALANDSSNLLFLFAKSTALLNLGRYGECVEVSDQMIQLCDTLAEPYYNAGTAYLNEALDIERRTDSRKYRPLIRNLYEKALPYMEKYQALAPQERKKWGPALYRIYLNLNMGKQFENIDKLLNSDN